MFEAFLVAALLTVTDPVGDSLGGGSLTPPSAPVYRNLAPFDISGVTVTDDEELTLVIEMESLSNPFELPLGFSLPVIEVYVEGEEGTGQELLIGSGMELPPGRNWQVALRLTGEQAQAYLESETDREVVTPELTVEGNTLTVRTPFARPEDPKVYAMTGLYDLFGASPWRPLSPAESPWAFSSGEGGQSVPVVDVLAPDAAAQSRALETGILPPNGGRSPLPGSLWLILMAAGLAVALIGIAMRIVHRRSAPSAGQMAGQEEWLPETSADEPGEVEVEPEWDPEVEANPVWVPIAERGSGRETGSAGLAGNRSDAQSTGSTGRTGADSGSKRTPGPAFDPPEVDATEGSGDEELKDTIDLDAEPTSNEDGFGTDWREAERDSRPGAVSDPEAEEAESPQGTPLKPFLWDSSALLTEPGDEDDEFSDEMAREFRSARTVSGGDVWDRPVPLPLEEEPTDDDSDDDDLLVSDDEGRDREE